jgi:glycosyltransferase involved in cell wall biosynthesis
VRVCHVCSGHSTDDGRVFHRACASLASSGYDVHLIATGTATENYCDKGVTVHPLPKTGSRRERFARAAQVAQIAAEIKPDLFHVHEPELLGAVISRSGGKPVIFDVHESYLDVLNERDWIPKPLRPLVRMMWDRRERGLVSRCAGVVVVTERIAARYREMHKKIAIVGNYPNLSEFENLPPQPRDGRTCVFAGMLSPDRGLLEVINALSILNKRGLAVPLALAGMPSSDEYLEVLLGEAKRLELGELVTYSGVLSKSEAIHFQNRGSIGLVPYLPVANSMASMANKLLEGMALGLPLVFSDFPNYKEVAGESGIAVDPTSPDEIANAIERLVTDPALAEQLGSTGRRTVRERLNWNVEYKKLLDLYQSILGPVPAS